MIFDKKTRSRIFRENEPFLKALYSMRVLDNTLLPYYYDKEPDEALSDLFKYSLIEMDYYGNSMPYYFLSANGVRLVKEEANYWGLKDFFAKDLKMKPFAVNHQMHLNYFVHKFMEQNKGREYTYFDEKFMPKCKGFIMPDGFIELDGTIYFLEMDMNTEDLPAIKKKWQNYRGFLSYLDNYYYGKKIICLFILENVKDIDRRMFTVYRSIMSEIKDLLSSKFQIYVGTSDELLRLINNGFQDNLRENTFPILKDWFKFKISKQNFCADYKYYIRKLDHNHKILVSCGRKQEYLMDSFLNNEARVLKNIIYHQKRKTVFKEKIGRELSYIVIIKSEKYLAKLVRTLDIKETDGVYFTTEARLKDKCFYEALFTVVYSEAEREYRLYHYTDDSLSKKVLEKRIAIG